MKTFGVIFVLYQPDDNALANLARACAACPCVVAVDNSPVTDPRLGLHLRDQGVHVIFNRNEGGLAGAYNRGAEVLLSRHCDLIFLLDQDSQIDGAFFKDMMHAACEVDTDAFLIGPKIYEIELRKCMPVIPPGKRFPRPVRIDDELAGLFPTLCIISSGSAISAAAYRKLGAFREDYFIEYVDVEYSLRASSRNVPVYMNAAVTLRQTQGRIERRGKRFTTNHPAWRRYYMARNSVHCLHLYRSLWGLHWFSALMTAQQAMSVLRFDSHKLKKLTAIACGCLDGMFGRLGTFERRHPRIAAFCRPAGHSGASQNVRRKLSYLEHLVEGNIVYLVRLEGSLSLSQLRSALARLQNKHPALRTLIRKAPDGLYYEADCAPEIPLRVVPRIAEDDYRSECRFELTTALSYDEPQLRAVWLRSERESDLLLTTSHRICDGMSMLTIVREVLRSLYRDEELIPYQPVTARDIIGDYQPIHPWKRKLAVSFVNGLLRLIPHSRRTPENHEHDLEWTADRAFSDALKQRCKSEGVSVHAAFLVALDLALFAAFGKKKLPKWIENPVDIRRGNFAALKADMVFFGGGSFKVPTGQSPGQDFWSRARTINEEVRRDAEREIRDIPDHFHLAEMLRPVTRRQIHSIVRLGDALKMNGSLNRFALSNLGNVVLGDSDAPFRVRDLRLYMHSFTFRVLCLVTYTLNGEMRFYCLSDDKCMSRSQMDTLKGEFMVQLQNQVSAHGDALKVARSEVAQ
jgi:rhamnosyltransferase